MAASASAFAQGNVSRDEQRDNRARNEQARPGENRGEGFAGDRRDGRFREDGGRREMRGEGSRHDFRKGGRLPVEYRSRYYVVDDWRGHSLSAPPRGYHWVQIGGDYVLVSNNRGIILQIYP